MTTPHLTALVLGVGGNVSQGIMKSIRHGSIVSRLVGACISSSSMGLYLADESLVSPRADDPSFPDWVADVCATRGIDAVLSGVEPVLMALAPRAAELRERTGAVLVSSSPDRLDVGADKLVTARWLQEKGLPFAPSALASDPSALEALIAEHGFPLVAKPRSGRSAREVREVPDDAALEPVRGRSGVVVQKLLGEPHDEYTVGCFCDLDGTVRGSIVMRRELLHGTTVLARVVDHPQVREVAESICSTLGPQGPCNVQLRVHDGVPTPFEINVRFSGTTPIRVRLGFDEVSAALRHFVLGEPVPELPRITQGLAIRYWNEIYVDPREAGALERTGALTHPNSAVEDWGMAR